MLDNNDTLTKIDLTQATPVEGAEIRVGNVPHDAQDGVDHVDGHRSPGYKVNSDGTGAGVTEDSIFYTQVNMTRTIEQILGLTPMNQFDYVASPMTEIFIDTRLRRTSCRGRMC